MYFKQSNYVLYSLSTRWRSLPLRDQPSPSACSLLAATTTHPTRRSASQLPTCSTSIHVRTYAPRRIRAYMHACTCITPRGSIPRPGPRGRAGPMAMQGSGRTRRDSISRRRAAGALDRACTMARGAYAVHVRVHVPAYGTLQLCTYAHARLHCECTRYAYAYVRRRPRPRIDESTMTRSDRYLNGH